METVQEQDTTGADPIDWTVETALRQHVEAALVAHRGRFAATALALGVDRKTLGRWRKRWGLGVTIE